MMQMRLSLLLLMILLSGCGRSGTDIYRAYGSNSAPGSDLGMLNRRSFQDGSHSGYLYVSPAQLLASPELSTDVDSAPAILEETDALLPGSFDSAKQPVVSRPTSLASSPDSPVKKAKPLPEAVLPAPVYRQAPAFELEDLKGQKRQFAYPLAKPTVMAFADQKGAEQMEAWITPLFTRYGERIEIHGVAELSAVPGFARGIARGIIAGIVEQPVMLDWTGKVSKQFGMKAKVTNIYLLDTQGRIVVEGSGIADLEKLTAFVKAIDPLLKP